MPVYQIGRRGRIYVVEETTYGVPPAPVAGDAIRHTGGVLNVNPENRVDSPERHAHPSIISRLRRRRTGTFNLAGLWYPSGTINTAPDHDFVLTNALGAKRSVVLSTTIASGPTTTGATLTSAAGLAINDAILINVTTGSPATGRVVRFLTSVAGAVVTWDPPLPQAPAVSDTVKGCITYQPATTIPKSLGISHYLDSLSFEGQGCVIEEFKLRFDASDELAWEINGPSEDRIRPAQTDPVTVTTVGTGLLSGLIGSFRFGASSEDMLRAEFSLGNGMVLDNFAYGTASARGYLRTGKRSVMVDLTAHLTDDVTLLTAGEGVTDNAVLIQAGNAEGSIVAAYAPKVEFENPEIPDNDELIELTFRGHCKGTTGNDEYFIAQA